MSIVLDGSVGISSIGTLTGVTSISSTTADTPVILQDSSSNSNTVRAWVNFNGTGTVAIRADFNVSSITDNGAGDYTVNFSVAMPDANYAINASGGRGTGSGFIPEINRATPTTSGVNVNFINVALNAFADPEWAMVSIFR
jgi:hypothetical protein